MMYLFLEQILILHMTTIIIEIGFSIISFVKNQMSNRMKEYELVNNHLITYIEINICSTKNNYEV